jgi:hypothetical protein
MQTLITSIKSQHVVRRWLLSPTQPETGQNHSFQQDSASPAALLAAQHALLPALCHTQPTQRKPMPRTILLTSSQMLQIKPATLLSLQHKSAMSCNISMACSQTSWPPATVPEVIKATLKFLQAVTHRVIEVNLQKVDSAIPVPNSNQLLSWRTHSQGTILPATQADGRVAGSIAQLASLVSRSRIKQLQKHSTGRLISTTNIIRCSATTALIAAVFAHSQAIMAGKGIENS